MRLWGACLAVVGIVFAVLLSGCSQFGRVNQGRVIEFDRSAGVVTIILDSNATGPGKRGFDLPPLAVRVPRDPNEMGPEPEAGKMMELDLAAGRAVIFDSQSGNLRTIPVTVVERQDHVAAGDRRVAGIAFPVIDRSQRTVTVYSSARAQLVRLSVAEEHLSLPPDIWKTGDDIRYYYKEPGQALRLMNVSRTDLAKGGH